MRRTANGATPPEATAIWSGPRFTRAGTWNEQAAGSSATLAQTCAVSASRAARWFVSGSSVAAKTSRYAAASPAR